jgi:hypothetical protein
LDIEVEVLKARIKHLQDIMRRADTWLHTWADHVGACMGGDWCDCGLTVIRRDIRSELEKP